VIPAQRGRNNFAVQPFCGWQDWYNNI